MITQSKLLPDIQQTKLIKNKEKLFRQYVKDYKIKNFEGQKAKQHYE
jgi:hypothetical protein